MEAIAGPGAGVRPAESAADREAAAEALALAFADDPCWSSPAARGRHPGGEAARLLQRPDRDPDPGPPRALGRRGRRRSGRSGRPPGAGGCPSGGPSASGRTMLGVFGRRLPLAFRANLQLEARAPEAPSTGTWTSSASNRAARGAASAARCSRRCSSAATARGPRPTSGRARSATGCSTNETDSRSPRSSRCRAAAARRSARCGGSPLRRGDRGPRRGGPRRRPRPARRRAGGRRAPSRAPGGSSPPCRACRRARSPPSRSPRPRRSPPLR